MDRRSPVYIESMCTPVTESGCWLWLGRKDPCGYGKIFIRGKEYGAHRVSFEAFNRQNIDGLHVIHACDTPSCVNPLHLSLSDHHGNMRDKAEKGRASRLIGENHPNSKLTANQVLDIFKSDEKASVLASFYNVKRNAIWAIRSGKKWTHITRNINE